MAKYKFDFSGFTVADAVEAMAIGRGESPVEGGLLARLLNVLAGEMGYQHRFQEDVVGNAITILNFAARFAVGYSLDDVPLEDLAVFCQDFVDAYEAFGETINNSQTPSPAEQ